MAFVEVNISPGKLSEILFYGNFSIESRDITSVVDTWLNVRLLGGFLLSEGDRPISLTSGRSQLLLAYLVLYSHTPQSRQRLAFLLWPDSTDSQARTNLRKELSGLRRVLPNADDCLSVDSKTLQWRANAPVTLDVAEFESAVRTAEQSPETQSRQTHLERALELYRGDFLPDYQDDWVVLERERLRQLQNRTLTLLIALLEEQRNYSAALTHAQHLLRLDDLNEAAYCTLMRLYGASGDRASALQLYHQCMTTLREEMGVEPSATTRKLYEQLLIEDTPVHLEALPSSPVPVTLPAPTPLFSLPARSTVVRSPLVGREQEWMRIHQWASLLLQGATLTHSRHESMLMLVGEPGIGKTRLLEELSLTAQNQGVQILWGQGFAAEMKRPYGIWIDALRGMQATFPTVDHLPPELGVLLPELGQPSQNPPDLSYLLDAVVQLLVQWAQQTPLLVLLDDIQWMDDASSALLHYALRLLRPLPVRFACSARGGELASNGAISQVLQALRREQQLLTLEVQPLDREQTADLIRSTQTLSPDSFSLSTVNQVFIDSGGNPLFALEITRSLGHPPSASLPSAPAIHAPTQTLEALIGDRLQQLDEATREFLLWAAALGRNFNPVTVAQIADYPMTRLLSVIEKLEQQALIRPGGASGEGARYDFAHNIVRQVVYQQLSEPRRQLMHWQIAHQLQQRVAQDEALIGEVAYHAALAADHDLATSAALAAAERCLKLFAYTEALELTQQGMHHSQFLEPPKRLPLQARLLGVQVIAGVTGDRAAQLETAVQQIIDQAQALGLVEAEAIALETLTTLQFERNHYGEILQHTLRIVEASQVISPATAARMLAHSGSCLAEIGREMLRAEALLLEAQTLANRVSLQSGDILCGLGCVHRHYGRYDEARSHLQRAWRLARGQQNHWLEGLYLSYLAMLEIETGNPDAALPYCHELSAVAAKIQGDGSEGAVAAALEALVNYHLQPSPPGLSQAEPVLLEAIALLQQVDAKRVLAYLLSSAAGVDLANDRPELAVQRAETALANAQLVNHPSIIALSWALLIQGLLALGELEQAAIQFAAFQPLIQQQDLSLLAQTQVNTVIQAMQADPAILR